MGNAAIINEIYSKNKWEMLQQIMGNVATNNVNAVINNGKFRDK